MFEQFSAGDSASAPKSFDSSNLYQQIVGPNEKASNLTVESAGRDSTSAQYLPSIQLVGDNAPSKSLNGQREHLTQPGDAASKSWKGDREHLTQPEPFRKGETLPKSWKGEREHLSQPEPFRKGETLPKSFNGEREHLTQPGDAPSKSWKGEREHLTIPERWLNGKEPAKPQFQAEPHYEDSKPKFQQERPQGQEHQKQDKDLSPSENPAVEISNTPANQGKLMSTVDAHRVSRTVGKYFYDMDQATNGIVGDRYITGKEMSDFLTSDKSRNLSAQERNDLLFAIKNERFISDASNDEFGRETSGITRGDLGKLTEHNSLRSNDEIGKNDVDRVSETLRKHFDKMDKHGRITGANGFVSAEEIREFLHSPDSRGLPAQEIVDLARAARNAEKIARASNDVWGMEVQGITKNDIEKLPGYIKN